MAPLAQAPQQPENQNPYQNRSYNSGNQWNVRDNFSQLYGQVRDFLSRDKQPNRVYATKTSIRPGQQQVSAGGMRKANWGEELAAKALDFGQGLIEMGGFDEEDVNVLLGGLRNRKGKDTNIFGVEGGQKHSFNEVMQSAVDFVKTIPFGMASAIPYGVAGLYEALTGSNVMQSVKQEDGTHLISDQKVTGGQQLASGIDAAINMAGLLAGGSGTLLRTLANGTRAERIAASNIARASQAGKTRRGLETALKVSNKVEDILNPRFIREAGTGAQVAWDIGEEAAEEFAQQQMQNIYYGNGTWTGDNSVWDPKNDFMAEAAGAAALGAAGGGIMTGVGHGIKAAANYTRRKAKDRSSGESSSEAGIKESASPNIPTITDSPDDMAPDYIGILKQGVTDKMKTPEPGVAPTLNLTPSADVRTDELEMSLGQIKRGILADRKRANEIAAQFGYSADRVAAFEDLVLRGKDSKEIQALRARYGEGTSVGGILTQLALENGGRVILWKEPSLNDAGAMSFKIARVTDDESQYVGVNPLVNKHVNADLDGDKFKIAWNPETLQTYGITDVLLSLASGSNRKAVFDHDYTYFDKSPEGRASGDDAINTILTALSQEERNEILAAYHDFLDETNDELSKEKERDLIDKLTKAAATQSNGDKYGIDSIFSDIFDKMQAKSPTMTDQQVSAAYRTILSKIPDMVSSGEITFDYIDTQNTSPKSPSGHDLSTIELLRSAYTFNADYTTYAKRMFRDFQMPLLHLKKSVTGEDGTVAIPVSDMYDLVLAHTARLIGLSENPVDAIEGLFKLKVYDEANFNPDAPHDTEEFESWLKGDFSKAYHEQVKRRNEAVKEMRMSEEYSIVPYDAIVKQEELKTDEDMLTAFFDVYGEMLPAEKLFPSAQGKGMNLKDYVEFMNEQKFSSSIVVNGPSMQFERSLMKKLAKLNVSTYARHDAMLRNAIKDLKDGIITTRLDTSEGINSLNYVNWYNAATTVAGYIGLDETLGMDFGNMNTILNNGFFTNIVDAATKQTDITEMYNAFASMDLAGKYFEVKNIMDRLNSGEELDVEVTQYVLKDAILRNLGSSYIHRLFVDDLITRVDNGQYDFSQTKVAQFMDMDISWQRKLEIYNAYCDGIDNAQPLLSAINVINSTPIMLSSRMKALKSAQRAASTMVAVNDESVRSDIREAKAFCEANHVSLINVAKNMYQERPARMSMDVFTGYLYTQIHGLTFNVMEKSKSEPGSQAFYQQVAMMNGQPLNPFTEDITGTQFNSMTVNDFIKDPTRFCDVLFDPTLEYKLTVPGKHGVIWVNQSSLYEYITGTKLEDPAKGMTDAEFMEVLENQPSIASWIVPQNLVTSETPLGVQTVSVAAKSFSSAVESYVKRYGNEPNRGHIREAFVKEILTNKKMTSLFIMTLNSYEDGRPIYHVFKPKEFSERVMVKFNEFVDGLTEMYINESKRTGGSSKDLEKQINEIVKDAFSPDIDRAYERLEDVAGDIARLSMQSLVADPSNISGMVESMVDDLTSSVARDIAIYQVIENFENHVLHNMPNLTNDRRSELVGKLERFKERLNLAGDEFDPNQADEFLGGNNVSLAGLSSNSTSVPNLAAAVSEARKFGVEISHRMNAPESSVRESLSEYISQNVDAFLRNPYMRSQLISTYIAREREESYRNSKVGDDRTRLFAADKMNESNIMRGVVNLMESNGLMRDEINNMLEVVDYRELVDDVYETATNSTYRILDIILENNEVTRRLNVFLNPLRDEAPGGINEDFQRLLDIAQSVHLSSDNSFSEQGLMDELRKCYDMSLSEQQRAQNRKTLNDKFKNNIIQAALADLSPNSLREVNPRAVNTLHDAESTLKDFFGDMLRNGTSEDGKNLRELAISVAPSASAVRLPVINSFDPNLYAIAQRADFEGYASYVVPMVGTEGSMQPIVQILSALKSIPTVSCSMQARPVGTLATIMGNPNEYLGKNIVINQQAIAGNQELMLSVLEENADGQGGCLLVFNERIQSMIARGILDSSLPVSVFEPSDCLGGPCAHHDMKAYDGSGVRRAGATQAENDFMAVPNILQKIISTAMEARLLKAKKAWNMNATSILHAAPEYTKGVSVARGNALVQNASDSQAMAAAFSAKKKDIHDYYLSLFEGKDATGKKLETGLEDLGFGDDQAWALANFFCRSVTITFAGPKNDIQSRTVDASVLADQAAWQQAITPPAGYGIQRIDANVTGLNEIGNKLGMTISRDYHEAVDNGNDYTTSDMQTSVTKALTNWEDYSTIDDQGGVKPEDPSKANMGDLLKLISQRRRGYAANNIMVANEPTALQKFLGMVRDMKGKPYGVNELSKFNENTGDDDEIELDDQKAYRDINGRLLGENENFSTNMPIITAAKVGKRFMDGLDGNISLRMLADNYGKGAKTISGTKTGILFAPDESSLTTSDVENALRRAISNGQGIYMPEYAFRHVEDNYNFFPASDSVSQYTTDIIVGGQDFVFIDVWRLGRDYKNAPEKLNVGKNPLVGKVLIATESFGRVSDSGSIINIDSTKDLTWNGIDKRFEIPFSSQFSRNMNGFGVTYSLATAEDMDDIRLNDIGDEHNNLDIRVVKKKLENKLDATSIKGNVAAYIAKVKNAGSIDKIPKTFRKFDCVCIVKRTDATGHSDYAPVLMDDSEIGRQITMAGNIHVNSSSAAFNYHGSDRARIGDAGKLILGGEAYKSMFRVSKADQFMSIVTGMNDRTRADIHFDVGALRGRIEGFVSNKLETTLHYSTFLYSTSLWESFDGHGKASVRKELAPWIKNDQEFLARLINGDPRAYRTVLDRGGPFDVRVSGEEQQTRVRQNAAICRVIRRCLELQNAPFSEIFAHTRLINGRYQTSGADFTHRLVFNGMSTDELLLFYNALCPKLCPAGFWASSDGKILDVEGNILQFDPTTNKYRRVETVIADHDFISPEINHTISGAGMRSSQTFLDNVMQHGPRDQDIPEYVAHVEAALGNVGSEYRFYKDRKRSDLIERYRAGDTSDVSYEQQRLLDENGSFKNAIMRNFVSSQYKKKLHETIDSIMYHPPRITETQDPTSRQMDISNEVSRVNEALRFGSGSPIEGISEFALRQMFADATCWTRGDNAKFGDNVTYQTFSNWVDSLITDINNGNLPLSSWQFQSKEERFNSGIFTPQVIHILANSSVYSEKMTESQMIDLFVEQAVNRRKLADSMTQISEIGKKKAIKDFINAHLYMLERFQELDSGVLIGDMSQAELMDFYERFNNIVNYEDADGKQQFSQMLKECSDATAAIAEWQRRKEEKRASITSYSDIVTTAKQPSSFGKFAMQASMLNKGMIFLNPIMLQANVTDRFVKNIGNRAVASMLAANIETEELLARTNGKGVPHDAIKAAAKNPQFKKAWRVYLQARMTGREINDLVNASSAQSLQELLDNISRDQGPIEKAFEKTAYFASGGDFGIETQLENFLTMFYVKAVEQGYDIMTSSVMDTTSEAAEGMMPGVTYFEARLQDPAKFFFEIMSSGPDSAGGQTNPSLIIANEAMNFAMSSDMTQKRILSIVYHELVKGHPVAELLFTSMCCPFVQYKINMINSMLGWILPMSSINMLANKYVASYADADPETGRPIKRWILKEGTNRAAAARAIGAEVKMAMPFTEFKQALMVDALRLGTTGLAFALLGCAAFEPPEDDEGNVNEALMGNIEEWTIFGYRIGANWWLQDTLGLALPIAAMYKATSMGYHRIDIITNGLSRVLFLNPAMKLSDAINAVINPDYEPSDYTLDCKMAAKSADGGSPDKLDWFLNSWQAAGLSWICQFFTPSIVKELYNSGQTYEKSYKRVVRTDEGGHAILDNNGNYQYVYTDYTDMALRRAARKNPVMGMVLNLIKHPTNDETGYLADQMPEVVYYDQAQIEMMDKYTLYEQDEWGDYVLKDEDEVQAGLLNIIATLQQYDDMKELASTGFYLDYNTKAYVSKFICDLRQSLKDMYYNDYDAGTYSEYLLGEGNYVLGQYIAQNIQDAYWDEIHYWDDFYKNKLWSKALGNKLQEYYRYNTTYLKDAAGNYYASGYRRDISNITPFNAAPEEGYNFTSGAGSQWASLSAITGEPMFDENGLPVRALVPQDEDNLPTPSIDSWQNYDVNNPTANQGILTTYSTLGNAYGNQYGSGYGSRAYGSQGGSRGYSRSGGGGYTRLATAPVHENLPRLYLEDPEQIYNPKQYKSSFDYLRPSYQTKGSREAYRREDF